jgi:3D-(3,5/4)-trihydroxycyclohexane-1,2-dione acylhydrolase (decyclizing)
VIVIDTDPLRSTTVGGWWWEVGIPEVSAAEAVRAARDEYVAGKSKQGR